jgi:hypothetical protein
MPWRKAGRYLSISIISVNYFNNLCQQQHAEARLPSANRGECQSTIAAGMPMASGLADSPANPGWRALNQGFVRSGDLVE